MKMCYFSLCRKPLLKSACAAYYCAKSINSIYVYNYVPAFCVRAVSECFRKTDCLRDYTGSPKPCENNNNNDNNNNNYYYY